MAADFKLVSCDQNVRAPAIERIEENKSMQIHPDTREICYWGHTTVQSQIKLCADGHNYVCPLCCHELCRVQYDALYAACARAGWPVWPPRFQGQSITYSYNVALLIPADDDSKSIAMDEQSLMYCYNCGQELRSDANFCQKCGTRQRS